MVVFYKTKSEKLIEFKKGEFKDFIELLELKQEEIEYATPEIIIEMTKFVNAKKLITAHLFNKEFFKNDLSPENSIQKDNWQSIDYTLKCDSSICESNNDGDIIYFNDILKSLDFYASNNLVYISFCQCNLTSEDLTFIVDIVQKYKKLQAIDLSDNRMYLNGTKSISRLNTIFNTNTNVSINFNGNYCEYDKDTLNGIYNSEKNQAMKGYIWIFESYIEENGWVKILEQYGLKQYSDMIKDSHLKHFEKTKKYTRN